MYKTWVSLAALMTMAACTALPAAQPEGRNSVVGDRVKLLTRASQWRPVAAIPIGFNTHHPQGMVKIGDTFFVTAVEIRTPTKRFAQLAGRLRPRYGRRPGPPVQVRQQGHADRRRAGRRRLHLPPGRHRLRRALHLAARCRVSAEQPRDRLSRRSGHDEGAGSVPLRRSRRRHRARHRRRHAARRDLGLPPLLPVDDGRTGRVTNADVPPQTLRKMNRSHYIDYQDCKYLGHHEMLCSGLNNYQVKKDGPRFALGGFEVVDLADRPGRLSGAGRTLDRIRAADDVQPVLGRGHGHGSSRLFHAGGREVDAVRLRRRRQVAILIGAPLHAARSNARRSCNRSLSPPSPRRRLRDAAARRFGERDALRRCHRQSDPHRPGPPDGRGAQARGLPAVHAGEAGHARARRFRGRRLHVATARAGRRADGQAVGADAAAGRHADQAPGRSSAGEPRRRRAALRRSGRAGRCRSWT